MSKGESKKSLEAIQTLKRTEPAPAVAALAKVATNPESEQDLRAAAVLLQRELEAPPTQAEASRRNELMTRAVDLANRNV